MKTDKDDDRDVFGVSMAARDLSISENCALFKAQYRVLVKARKQR